MGGEIGECWGKGVEGENLRRESREVEGGGGIGNVERLEVKN